MKTLERQAGVMMKCVALTWCLVAPAAGVFLNHRQVPGVPVPAAAPPVLPAAAPPAAAAPPVAVAPVGVSQEAQAHVQMVLMKLEQEADLAVEGESAKIEKESLKKQQEARDAIEREIPLAAANDTQEISKDVAEQDKKLDDALKRSTKEAEEAVEVLMDKTEDAVNMSAVRAVRNVEKEAEQGAMDISNHSAVMEAEAVALSKFASSAATRSKEAADNSALWVKELPTEKAAVAVKEAQDSADQSVQLRHEYEDVKRMAKLAGNLGLNTIRVAQQAIAQTEKAAEEATLTVEQASQNALLLNTIRKQVKDASQTALGVVSQIPSF